MFPQKLRSYLKDNPKTFFFTSLGAVLPDLDIFTSGHRAYGHSVFYPLFLLVISPLVERLFKRENLSKNIRIFGLFILSHLLYDTTFGPLALFYPIDTRFYDILIGLVIDLSTKVITPVGFFVSVSLIDQRTGVSTFFLNWSPAQRVSVFGVTQARLAITDFFVHATIFIWYVFFVVIPVIRSLRKKQEAVNKREYQLNWKIKPWITTLCLLLLTTGFFFSGPFHGRNWVDTGSDSFTFEVKNDQIQLLGSKSFRVAKGGDITINVTSELENFNYSIFVASMSTTEIQRIQKLNSNLFNQYQDGNLSYTSLLHDYQDMVESNISTSAVQPINSVSQKVWKVSANEDVSLIFGLYQWNTSYSFSHRLHFDMKWNIPLDKSFQIGLYAMIITGCITLLSAIYVFREQEYL